MRAWVPRAFALVIFFFFLGSGVVRSALGQTQPRAPSWRDCGSGVSIRLSARSAAQGNLLRLEVQSGSTMADIKGEWNGKAIEFWPDAARKNLERALLGVDLETPAGGHDVTIEARFADGGEATCRAMIAVSAGKFAVEKLQVAQQFVEPNAEEIARADKEGQRLREILASVTPERLWNGRFRLPLSGAHTAKNFGRRRVLNGQSRSPHTGVDIPAATGTPVLASQRGRIVLADNLFFSGNTVVVNHGLGVYTFYGHLSAIAVKQGDTVVRGALLGKVGATGRVTGPHLHWGLTVDGARVNPLQIVGVPLG